MKPIQCSCLLLGFLIAILCFWIYGLLFPKAELEMPDENFSFITIEKNIANETVGADNIFFIETKTRNFHKLDSFQACGIESAGEMNFC